MDDEHSSAVIMVFLDGVGLGPGQPDSNPLAHTWMGLESLSRGRPWIEGTRVEDTGILFKGIDACLGLDGLPQSGTGQATLFTGVNCAVLAGRHYGPYPHSATRGTLRERSVFAQLGAEHTAFANAYPPRFFQWVNRTKRWPVTTRACLDAGVRIRTIQDLQGGTGVAADVTGQGLVRDLGLPVTEVTPQVAAQRLLDLAAERRFVLFEVFHTDKAGHAQDHELAKRILQSVDALLGALVGARPEHVTIVVSSDHGNVEDLSVKTHTRNDVPLAVVGPGAVNFRGVRDLAGVTPAILETVD